MKKSFNKNKIKKFFKKFWEIVWKDTSFKGWIITILFLFISIQFIFFPLLSLTTGTKLPLVIVESCSMYHEDGILSNYESWFYRHDLKYFEYKINKKNFDEFPFRKGFSKGDILFVTGVKPEKIKIGDVIIFEANYEHPIIHRVININEEEGIYTFSTLGDNNDGQLSTEKEIHENQIVGKAQANILPFAGWIKLIFVEPLQPETNKGFCKEY